jgi:nitrite reductase/ring-hydroxylating ferredoxin subunit
VLARFQGEVYAFDSLCTHEAAELLHENLKDDVIACPLHGSEFDIKSGEVLFPPAELPLKTYKVKIDAGTIMVEV